MTDNLSVFWQNNDTAAALFYNLLARTQREAYDDDFLAQLAAYRTAGGDAVHADIFAVHYLLHECDAENAVLCAERAYENRPTNHAVWQLLARGYRMLGRHADALVMQGYLSSYLNVPIALDLPKDALTQETLDRLSVAMGKPGYAPITVYRMTYADGALRPAPTPFSFEFLPAEDGITPPYYVGVYTEQEIHGGHAWQLAATRNTAGFAEHVGADFNFDIMRARRAPGSAEITLTEGQECVLPVLGTAEGAQEMRVRTKTLDDTSWLNSATPNFFRLSESTALSSDRDFIVGTPIRLGHAPHRCPLVLNILVDALPWQILGADFAARMPQTARFFEKGLTFHQTFSTAEYTYPSLAAIETGMYAQTSRIFNDRVVAHLAQDRITLSERMKELGYTTVSLMGDGNGIYNGVTRGYDRLIVTPYALPTYEGVERVMRYLDGLSDADHFIFLHTVDLHPWPNSTFASAASVQARLPLADRLEGALENMPSPYLRPTALNQATFWQNVRNVDRALGTLFSYLEENYTPEEYLVNLYSDHGVPIFSTEHWIADAQLTRTAWMMRGAGVPEGGHTDELTSTVDLYPVLGALCNFPVSDEVDGVLPRVFGGAGRDLVFSNSLYPTKPYVLAARSKEHTLCLETQGTVGMDGTVDLAHANVAIYPRAHENEAGYAVDSPELRAFFYPRVREFLRGIGNNGEIFPLPTKD